MTEPWAAHIRARLRTIQTSPDEGVILEWAQHAESAFAAARADDASPAEADAHVRALIDEWCTNLAGLD